MYLLEEELREVGAVLARDTGDDGLLCRGCSLSGPGPLGHLGLLSLGFGHLKNTTTDRQQWQKNRATTGENERRVGFFLLNGEILLL